MMEQLLGEMLCISYFLSLVFLELGEIKFCIFSPFSVHLLITTMAQSFVCKASVRSYMAALSLPSPVYLWFKRFYLKEFRGSRRWLLFLEGEYLKTQLFNLVFKGQLVLV